MAIIYVWSEIGFLQCLQTDQKYFETGKKTSHHSLKTVDEPFKTDKEKMCTITFGVLMRRKVYRMLNLLNIFDKFVLQTCRKMAVVSGVSRLALHSQKGERGPI